MEISLSHQTEQDIIKLAENGDYVLMAQHLADAILAERPTVKPSLRERAVDQLRKDANRQQSWQDFRKFKTAEEIAAEQGIGPIRDPNDLVFPDWPEGESVDDFIKAAKGLLDPIPE